VGKIDQLLSRLMQLVLIALFIFTPLAFSAVELWAYSSMELGILLLIVLGAFKMLSVGSSSRYASSPAAGFLQVSRSLLRQILTSFEGRIFLLFLSFLLLILLQAWALPAALSRFLSPKAFELRRLLFPPDTPLMLPLDRFPISYFPLATRVEFYKWAALGGLFFFLLYWGRTDEGKRTQWRVLPLVVFGMGAFESLYGIIEFFSGHRHILTMKAEAWVSSVTGTFLNRNNFAGYLLMVIPLSIGLFYSRQVFPASRRASWRHYLASLDGKAIALAFGIVVMILALLFSASRMGISSLLLSFGLITLIFRNPLKKEHIAWKSFFVLLFALVWATGIGLDPVIGRFFQSSDDLEWRWKFWVDTFRILLDYPILGTGLGTFAWVSPMYRSFPVAGWASHAENDLLQLATEVGLVGIVLLAVLSFLALKKAAVTIRALPFESPERYIAIGGLIGILALLFHSLVEKNIQVPANGFLFTFVLAMVCGMSRPERK